MNWNLYSILNLYGDFIKLNVTINVNQVLKDIEPYCDYWSKYNPNKPKILRDSLAVTSIDGSLDEKFNTSLTELFQQTGKNIEESDYNKKTEVYKNSSEISKILDPWEKHLARTQFIKLPPGGHFPIHIDGGKNSIPETFRLAVPIKNTNPPNCWWMLGDDLDFKPLKWEYGKLYYINTLKRHALFNTSDEDSIWLIINIITTEESVRHVRNLI